MANRRRPVICAVSGGVDSAVSLLRLKRSKEFEVRSALFMRNWDAREELDTTSKCTSDKDETFARQVCDRLSVPLHIADFSKDYWNDVFTTMISKYRAGLTPNPDILCNKFIKFGSLRNYIDLFFGCDHFIATGHYADVNLNGSQSAATLAIPLDKVKDQTFFLSQVSQNALQKTLFPLANIVKKDVKKIARESTLGFVNEKKESMGLCFVGERKFNEFLKDYIPIRKGQVVDFETGQFMGEHEGVQFYTSGQSLLLQYVQKCRTEFFVYNRDSIENILYVVKGRMNPLLWRSECKLRNFHWISGKLPDELRKKVVMTCQCRMQHGWPLINCDISIEHGLNPFDLEDTEEFTIKVKVHGRCWAVTPGQFCVLYEDEVCLGSGEILPFENDEHEL